MFENSSLDNEEMLSDTNNDKVIVLDLKNCPVKKRQVQNSSPVWKHFCQNSVETNTTDQGVYCIHCLKDNTITRYREGTSTTSLKNHLTSKHEINPEESPPPDLLLTSSELILKIAAIESEMPNEVLRPKRTIKKHHTSYRSKARRFFSWTNNGNNCLCILCAEIGIDQSYSSNTSATILKRHLTEVHKCDPETDDRELPEIISFDLPEEIKDLIDERVGVVTGKVGHYFINLPGDEDNLYCCFCLKENLKQVYSPQSGLTVLKNHLAKRHKYVGLKLKLQNPNVKLTRGELDLKLDEKIVNLAQRRASTPGLKPRKYFIRLGDDAKDIFCVFCLSERIKYRYRLNGSLVHLRRHLQKQHKFKFDTEKPNHKEVTKEDCDPVLEEEHLLPEEHIESETNTDTNWDTNLEVKNFEEIETIYQEIENEVEDSNGSVQEPHPTLANSCRLCGKSGTNFTTNIFDAVLDLDQIQQVTLVDAVEIVIGITVTPTDLKSHLICFICMASLKSAVQFRLNTIENENRSDQILRETIVND